MQHFGSIIEIQLKPSTLTFSASQFVLTNLINDKLRDTFYANITIKAVLKRAEFACGICARKLFPAFLNFTTKHGNVNTSGFHVNFPLNRRLCKAKLENWTLIYREKHIQHTQTTTITASKTTTTTTTLPPPTTTTTVATVVTAAHHSFQHVALNEYQFRVFQPKKINCLQFYVR